MFVCLLPGVGGFDSQNSQPFGGSVAVAGKSMPGSRWCECGTTACICDPGELPCTTCPNQGLVIERESEPADSINPGSVGVLALVILTLVFRVKLAARI